MSKLRYPTIHNTQVLTTQQAAEYLGLSVSTIQQLVESRALAAWKTAGGHRRIPIESIQAFLENSESVSIPPPTEKVRRQALWGLSTTTKLLILEDDPIQLTAYRSRIDSWKLPLLTTYCDSGYKALIEVATQQPDILLLDIAMDGIDGHQVLQAIMQKPSIGLSHIAVLTQLSIDEIEEMGGLPQGVLHMPKPINFDELKGYLRACCAIKERAAAR